MRNREPQANGFARFIPEVWATDTIAAAGLMEAFMILVSPKYPHSWRRGFHWWHRRICYGCIEAKVKWPLARRKFRHAMTPLERDLPLMPPDKAKEWVEQEILDLVIRTPRGFK